jgi:pimeloyl-ACP methyl ester carboxylesterase
VGLLFASGAVASCSSSSSSPAPFAIAPASTVVADPGTVKIRREIFLVDGVTPPPNPMGNVATPAAQNKVRVIRYRVDADPPLPARAVVVMMPGFLAGGGAFDGIARAVVRRSTATDPLEAWAIDRRANLLEDTWGLDVAEVTHDIDDATNYYFEQEAVEGKTFAGILEGGQIPWASEWGLATTVGDLRNVLSLLAPADRKSRVVLLGHSLGASIVEEYAAWDFDGSPGYDDVAAIALLDGVTGSEGATTSSIDQPTYENGGMMSTGGVSIMSDGVNAIRQGDVYTTLPFLGTKAYLVAEYTAMRATWTPTAVEADSERDDLLGVLLGVSPVPKMTDRAALGFAFDEASCPLTFVRISCGEGNGGAITPYTSALGGAAVQPSDPNATYGWTDYNQTTPPKNTSLDDFALGWFEGPGTNFAEWYFPSRLTLDAEAAGTLNVTSSDWRSSAYGIQAMHGADIDAPILAVALALVGSASSYDALQSLVAPIGAGRPNAGLPRTDPSAFTSAYIAGMEHVDGISGADVAGSLPKQYYDMLVDFALAQTPAGGVAVPVQPAP